MDGELLVDVVGGDTAVGSHPQNAVLLLRHGGRGDFPDISPVLGVQLTHQGVLFPLALRLKARAYGRFLLTGGPLLGGFSDILHCLTSLRL